MRWNRLFIYSLIVIGALYFVGCSADKERSVPEGLRTKALGKIKYTLENGDLWERVHAAEFLLNLGYSDDIYEVYRNEEPTKRNIYQQRIGIWRVLAQASHNREEKQQWIDSIASVFKNPNAPDRVHAAESLAKLRVSPYDISPDATDSILSGENNALWLYTLWGTAYTKGKDKNQVKNQLANVVSFKKNPNGIRRLAAYALRNMKDAGINNWNLLMDAAVEEPDISAAYIYILSSALINTPSDSLSLAKVVKCKTKMMESFSNPAVPGKYEALLALGELGNEHDLQLLSSLINGSDEFRFNNEADIAAAASNAVLRIDRRQKYTLTEIDWVVIIIYGLAMLLVGWYYSRKTKNTEDYLLGGRKMRSFVVGVSLFITMISSLSFLSYPGEMVKNGPTVFIAMLIFPLIYYIVGWFLIPKFMEIKVSSAYELLEKRLGLRVRMLATFFFLTLRFFWMATIIYATINTALVAVVDIPSSYTSYIGILLMLLTILYTSMGGFKAVITTDVLQSIILWVGVVLAIIFVIIDFQSFTSWLPDHYLRNWDSLRWGIDLHERSTVGNIMVFLLSWYICTNGSDQMAVQRYLSTKDIRAARRSFGISLAVTFVVKILLAVVGLAMIAYFTKHPHFLNDGKTLYDQADNLLPKFILVGLPIGISGLVVSGILAAAMSSLSSGLNSSSSVITEDIIKRLTPRLVSKNPLKQVKIISVFVGIIAIFLSLLVGNVEGNLLDVVVKVVNTLVAPLFVLFFMAIFIPFATSNGTIIGGLLSIAMAVAVSFWNFLGIEVFWIMAVAFIVGAVTGIVASLVEKLFLERIFIN